MLLRKEQFFKPILVIFREKKVEDFGYLMNFFWNLLMKKFIKKLFSKFIFLTK